MLTNRSGWQITAQPSGYALSVDDVKAFLAIDSTAFDDQLQQLILAGTTAVENATGRKLLTQTVAEYFDAFPRQFHYGHKLRLLWAPVQSVTSIAYVDTSGDDQTWDAANYDVDLVAEPASIRLADGGSLPSTKYQLQAVTITYQVGHGTADDVPDAAQRFILNYCLTEWERRPPAAEDLRHRQALISELMFTL